MMKKLMPYLNIAVIAVALMFPGCASTGGSTGSGSNRTNSADTAQIDDPAVDLTDYLRQFPSIMVAGSGANASIRIRGVNSMNSGTDPLFILDGVRVGRNFSDLYNRVRMNEVSEVRVLRGVEASMYGSEGANGVIMINRIQQ